MSGPYLLVAGDFVQTGGMDAANHALARHLLDRGREVHLVAHRVEPALAARPGVVVHRVPKPLTSYFVGGPLLDAAGRSWGRRVLARSGRVVVNGGNCGAGDVNWVHYVHAAFRPEGRFGAWRRLKVAASDALYRAQEARRISRARVVVANSERTRADVVERLGIAPERVRVVYYGVDPERFRPGTTGEREQVREELGVELDRPLAAFVGALGDRRKGFDVLFDAWRQLCARSDWDAVLLVVGRGAELDAWRRRTEQEGLSGRIRFLGFRDDVPRLLRGCDALVSPTRYEAYGLGVQEALCTGLPAVVSARAGVAERFPPELRELLLEDPESPAELRALLERWRGRLSELSGRALALSGTLRAYTWETMGERFLAAVGES